MRDKLASGHKDGPKDDTFDDYWLRCTNDNSRAAHIRILHACKSQKEAEKAVKAFSDEGLLRAHEIFLQWYAYETGFAALKHGKLQPPENPNKLIITLSDAEVYKIRAWDGILKVIIDEMITRKLDFPSDTATVLKRGVSL